MDPSFPREPVCGAVLVLWSRQRRAVAVRIVIAGGHGAPRTTRRQNWRRAATKSNIHFYLLYIEDSVFPLLRLLLYLLLQHPLLCHGMIGHWSEVTHPSAKHNTDCLTAVILRELVFPTW